MDGSHNTMQYNTFMEKTLPHGLEYINQCWVVLDFGYELVSHIKQESRVGYLVLGPVLIQFWKFVPIAIPVVKTSPSSDPVLTN
jgi:hypothetical protein